MTYTRSLLTLTLVLLAMGAEAAAPTITTAVWLPEENNKLRVLGENGVPNERVYVRVPETVGNRHVQADGSFRFNKTGVFPPPCEVHLLPQFGAPGPTHPIADPRDFATGDAIRHECMPEPTKSIFEAHEFGAGLRWLVRPAEWCRWDPDAAKSLYWARPASGDCNPDVGHQEMVIALDDARTSALANGASPQWIHPTTDLIITDFTVDAMSETAGAFSSPAAAGHVLLSTQSFNSTAPGGYCTAVHEFQHANIQYAIFPSMTADIWGTGVWPEALAMLHMRDVAACADFWDELHSPWNSRWVTGYYGAGERRQMGLFYGFLQRLTGTNWYDWMLNQHTLLLAGDEVGALNAEIWAISHKFVQFVHYYNTRNIEQLPGIDALGPPEAFPNAGSSQSLHVLNGMIEGDSVSFTLPITDRRHLEYQHSQRCNPIDAWLFIRRDDGGTFGLQTKMEDSLRHVSGDTDYFAGAYTATVASLEGTTHLREALIPIENYPDPLPPPATNDPWGGEVCP